MAPHSSDVTRKYESVLTVVKQCVGELIGEDVMDMPSEVTLLELGVQSLDFVDLVFHLGRIYGIQLPRSYSVPDTHTLETFARGVVESLAVGQVSTRR
jgi:acyl carrier protein